MAKKSRIYIKPSKRGSLRKALGTPKGKNIPASKLAIKKGDSVAMKKKKIFAQNARKWKHEMGGFLPVVPVEEMGFGGWLKENAGTIGTVAGAIGGAAIGVPGLGATIGGTIGNLAGGEAEEIANPYQVPTSAAKQFYQPYKMGGKLTRYNGPVHEQGGIPLGGLPVEVEGGETRYGDMIFNDNPDLKITPNMIRKYPILKKSDKNKTLAQITDERYKKFEKRPNDEMAMKAADISMLPLQELSQELSGMGNEMEMRSGGDISAEKAREILKHGSIRNKPLTKKQRGYFGAIAGGNLKAASGFDLSQLQEFGPMIASGADLIGSLIGGPEKVDYGKTSYVPMRPTLMSTAPGIGRIRQGFGNASKKTRMYNPSRAMAMEAELAAQEAGAITDYSLGVESQNINAINRANEFNAQAGTSANFRNQDIAIGEDEANAANRAAWKSRMSADLANLGTMFGQRARDEKEYAAQDERNRILKEYLGELAKISGATNNYASTEALPFMFGDYERPELFNPAMGFGPAKSSIGAMNYFDPYANSRLKYRPTFK